MATRTEPLLSAVHRVAVTASSPLLSPLTIQTTTASSIVEVTGEAGPGTTARSSWWLCRSPSYHPQEPHQDVLQQAIYLFSANVLYGASVTIELVWILPVRLLFWLFLGRRSVW